MSDIKLTEETLQPTPVMNDNFKNTDWRLYWRGQTGMTLASSAVFALKRLFCIFNIATKIVIGC